MEIKLSVSCVHFLRLTGDQFRSSRPLLAAVVLSFASRVTRLHTCLAFCTAEACVSLDAF